MEHIIPGIHHVTAIAGPAQQNVDFYAGFLGFRLVKQTVNFDDPATYHLYFGDEAGHPGSILTFFPWPDAHQGRAGAGMPMATAYAVSADALDFWMGRFADEGRPFDAPEMRFGQPVLGFEDPDGLRIEFVADPGVPAESALTPRRFHSTTLLLGDPAPTARLLADVFGFEAVGEEGGRLRFRSSAMAEANIVDLATAGSNARGRPGKGTVHHVAFRARDDAEQVYWREQLLATGLDVTSPVDRQYFRSIYFREPGGVLFEIATDAPGFAVDEAAEELGTSLKLPPWFEPRRAQIERRLPPLHLPAATLHSNPKRR